MSASAPASRRAGGGRLLAAGSWYDSVSLTAGSSLERRQGLAQLRHRLGGFKARLLGLYGRAGRSAYPEDSGGPRLAVIRERERGMRGHNTYFTDELGIVSPQ